MLFGCLIEKSYHKIGFCEAKGFIHFAFRILHFAFSSSPLNCNLSPILHEPEHDLGGRLGGGGQEGGVIGEGVLVPAVGDGAEDA